LQIVAGTTLSSLKPDVWNPNSEYYLPNLTAIMISYADFHKMPARRRKAMDQGLRNYLGVPDHVKIYLDNGAFYFISHHGETPVEEYTEFVKYAQPDWFPIPQDFIPTPKMPLEEQKKCLDRTMAMNIDYSEGDYVPVVHISPLLEDYLSCFKSNRYLLEKKVIALGGIVPNLLKAPKAMHPRKVLEKLIHVRQEFRDKKLHIFGIGGTITLHIAALLGINSVDSSGWRNRAARGTVQLPGKGDRMVANLGSWRGREPNDKEWEILAECQCPACKQYGLDGLKANLVQGFRNRATHNLWVLLEEARLIEEQLVGGDYENWYLIHLDNTLYKPLIKEILELEKNLQTELTLRT
jgi:7-cyano-7-deazaguanine tRNA-ribosyltransferase